MAGGHSGDVTFGMIPRSPASNTTTLFGLQGVVQDFINAVDTNHELV